MGTSEETGRMKESVFEKAFLISLILSEKKKRQNGWQDLSERHERGTVQSV